MYYYVFRCLMHRFYLKIVANRFGVDEKSATFAIPFEKRAAVRAVSSLRRSEATK